MVSESRTNVGWLVAAVICWLASFAIIVYACFLVIGAGRSVWSGDFLLAVAAHGVLSVGVLWLLKRALPPSAAADDPAAEAVQQESE
jgi:hypothetical protein